MTNLLGPDVVIPTPSLYGAIFRTAESVLTAITTYFASVDVGLPDYQYVTLGDVAADCDLLAVGVDAVRHGNAGGTEPYADVGAGSQYLVDLTVHLLRRVPMVNDNGDPPPMDALIASGQGLLRDMELLRQCIVVGRLQGASGDPGAVQGSPFLRAAFGPLAAYGPDGGIGGTLAPFVLQLA